MQNKSTLVRWAKYTGLLVGTIGFISSVIGIYSFLCQDDLAQHVAGQLQKWDARLVAINDSIVQLRSDREWLEDAVKKLETMSSSDSDQPSILAERRKIQKAVESYEARQKQVNAELGSILESIKSMPSGASPSSSSTTATPKEKLQREKEALATLEEKLQREKEAIQREYEMSKQFRESFEQMREGAEKRFRINI